MAEVPLCLEGDAMQDALMEEFVHMEDCISILREADIADCLEEVSTHTSFFEEENQDAGGRVVEGGSDDVCAIEWETLMDMHLTHIPLGAQCLIDIFEATELQVDVGAETMERGYESPLTGGRKMNLEDAMQNEIVLPQLLIDAMRRDSKGPPPKYKKRADFIAEVHRKMFVYPDGLSYSDFKKFFATYFGSVAFRNVIGILVRTYDGKKLQWRFASKNIQLFKEDVEKVYVKEFGHQVESH